MTRAERDAMIHELRDVDGLTSLEVALRVGLSAERVRQIAPGRPGKIDNTRLREAFLRSGKSANAVAKDLGWCTGRKHDASRVRQALGITLTRASRGRGAQYRTFVDAETLGRIAESIGVEPWEVGCNDA